MLNHNEADVTVGRQHIQAKDQDFLSTTSTRTSAEKEYIAK